MSVENKDHRVIAKELDLYFSEDDGQGLPFLLPNYTIIRNQIQAFLRQKQKEFGFQEVITPVLGSEELYQTSGHLPYYQDYMFPTISNISKKKERFRLRPMTCPHHFLIYQQKPRSYRELPLRLCEDALLHRYEASGGLKGLERSRWMELSDHHIFVNSENLKEEIKKIYYYAKDILANLNFSIERLICSLHDSTNKEKYHADEQIWQKSESLLIELLEEMNLTYLKEKGEAAFYGPKLDFEVKAQDGKYITIGTIQLDFISPQRFNLKYIDKEQNFQIPMIIHHSPIGTYQRFIALLLEKTGGRLPFWLAPTQLVILPLNNQEEVKNCSEDLQKRLSIAQFRSEIWSDETLGYSIKKTHQKKIPYYLVIGKEEIKTKKMKLHHVYSQKEVELAPEDLIKYFESLLTRD